MDGLLIVPSPAGDAWSEVASAPLELARATQGKLFEKHILNKGTLIHPKTGERIKVDDNFVAAMMRNFEDGVCDIVQVPVADAKNQHTEDPRDNIGEVVGIRERDGKVYAVVDARDPEAAAKLGKTYLGASAFLSTNYVDSRTGKKAGPTLLHVAVTNRPYVTNLEGYREIVAATSTDDNTEVIVMTQEEPVPTLDELKAMLRDDHGIDVDALQASATQPSQTDLATAIAEALAANPAISLSASGEQITGEDLVGAVVELSQQNATLAAGYQEMRKERAADRVDALVGTGHILPKQRDFAVNLLLSRPAEFEEFVPAEPIVPVGEQTGFTPPREERETAEQEGEIARLTQLYTEQIAVSNARRK